MNSGALTDESYWDDYWAGFPLPFEIRATDGLYVNALTETLSRHMPHAPAVDMLEVGGAPGQYLAYFHRRFGYRVWALDSSTAGCELTRRNFELLGIDGTVVAGDLFDPPADLPQFDVVYSLGLVEHFTDVEAVVDAHARLVKPGGILAIGCPNFLGLNGLVLRRLAPAMLSKHNRDAMDLRRWGAFEGKLGLRPRFRGYLGGFEPGLAARHERDSRVDWLLATFFSKLAGVLNRPRTALLRRLNSRYWSGYALAVWEVRR